MRDIRLTYLFTPQIKTSIAGILTLTLLTACGGNSAPSEQLTLEQKVGQMVMMGVDGTTTDAPGVRQALDQVRSGHLGGVILYRYNITSPTQVRALTNAFHKANPLELPLLVALDQEGGLVQRLRASNGFVDTPSHEEVASTLTPAQAYNTYSSMARMVASAGFNFNFGPVVDLRGDPLDPEHHAVSPVIGQLKRSFSDDPAVVVKYATQFVMAHREAGVLTALKHYPGHGLATNDSHLGLVDTTHTAQAIEQWPFQHMVTRGLADAIMTAHLVNRNIDPIWPVTLSERFIYPQLRVRDGFRGVIVTDDLHMGAIQQHHSMRESVVRAILAGNDVLVFSNNPGAAKNVPDFAPRYDIGQYVATLVQEAIDRGELSTHQVDEAWKRIAQLRSKLQTGPSLPSDR